MMLCIAEVMATYALELGSQGSAGKYFWFTCQFLGYTLLPPAWLIFTLQYTGQARRRFNLKYLLFLIEPIILFSLVWTNPWHHLVWDQVRVAAGGAMTSITVTYQQVYWIQAAYSFILIFTGIYFLWQAYPNVAPIYRRQIRGLIIIAVIPGLFQIFYMAAFSYFLTFNPIAISFTIVVAMFYWGSRNFWQIDILPVARSVVVESMSEGVIVLDSNERIIDLNHSACQALGKTVPQLVGRQIREVLPGWENHLSSPLGLARDPDQQEESHFEIQIGPRKSERSYLVRIAPLRDPSRVLTGYLIIWSDITDREKAEVILRRQLEDMTVIHLVATACLKAEEENDLIRKITKIIGSSIYTDNFGVLMLDPATGALHVHPSYHGVPDQEIETRLSTGRGNYWTGGCQRTGTAYFRCS